MGKIVDSFHYYVWTDALHLRAIAHQARNRWDRGTYVRSTLTNACTTLETACNDALDVTNVGYSFRKNLDGALNQKLLPPLDWSQGLWKEVSELLALRKEFVHKGISTQTRFTEAAQADKAIDVCRRAIKAIYVVAHKNVPAWVDDDTDPGFKEGGPRVTVHGQLTTGGADPNLPDTIKIAYVYKDREYISEHHPAGTDHRPLLDDLITRLQAPVSAVRAYCGSKLIEERELLMRGN
jgi:hypothetical protein